jgi:hypothetical protein
MQQGIGASHFRWASGFLSTGDVLCVLGATIAFAANSIGEERLRCVGS